MKFDGLRKIVAASLDPKTRLGGVPFTFGCITCGSLCAQSISYLYVYRGIEGAPVCSICGDTQIPADEFVALAGV